MKFKFIFPILVFVLLFSEKSTAQRGWEAGGWLGTSTYFGDLNTDWRLNRLGLAAGAFGRYNFNDRVCLKLGGNYANISADDADSKNVFEQRRNLSFKTLLIDGAATFEFNFLPYIHGHRDYFYTPYMFAGFAGFYSNPKTKYEGKWEELRPLGTEGQFRGDEYNTIQGAFAYGLGLKMDINYRLSFNVDFSLRNVWTDYLDDVSGVYPDLEDLRALRGDLALALSDRSVEPKIGQAGRQRGNGKKNDMYAIAGVSLVWYFGDIRCPSVTRK